MSADATCFLQGYQDQMHKLAFGRIKSALNPRMAGATAAPFIDKELAALGERLFHDSYRNPGVWTGLKSAILPGYRQLRGVHEMLARQHTPEELQQAFTAIGQTAKPRMDFFNRAIPAAAGTGVGGAALGIYGRVKGEEAGRQNVEDEFGNAPLMDRLKYMLAPQRYLKSQHQPAAADPELNY